MQEGQRGRDDRRSGPDRKETQIPSDDVIRKIIQESDSDELVKQAEGIGSGLAKNEGLKTNQIRAFFSEVKRIEGSIRQREKKDKLEEPDRRRLVLMKPKLAYQAHRQMESHSYGVAKLEQALKPAIGFVGDKVKNFQNFVDFFEAILAYHKAAGGKDK